MKKKLNVKRLSIFIGAILLILILSTYFVGSYFINYALVPNKGGGERKINKNLMQQKQLDGYEPVSEDLTTTISKVKQEDKELCDKWLKAIADKMIPVNIKTKDNLILYGTEIEHPHKTDRWVIILHGYQSDENESLKIARHFYDNGINILTYNLRAHGKSEGKYIGMGFLDKDDLFLWTEFIVNKNANAKIIYHGTSMGGATVLFASGLPLPENVTGIISDCAYADVWEIFSGELKNRFSLPDFPILYIADIIGRIKASYSIKNASVVEAVKKAKVPILFIHSTSDDFVPVSMAKLLYDAHSGEKDLYIVNGVNHTEAKYANIIVYYETIFNFLKTKTRF